MNRIQPGYVIKDNRGYVLEFITNVEYRIMGVPRDGHGGHPVGSVESTNYPDWDYVHQGWWLCEESIIDKVLEKYGA
jgi:hypothetical protein